ncbi:Unknown protein [Striga hermonthica]|uniref:Retroviral polymerase SH3-like domain-containing protein n=1 Tax=Striga hermonthica TaxID=68872 RepID=A0A9N7N4X4_STRHE|nr:Unknown protein [Striga hermonthica]
MRSPYATLHGTGHNFRHLHSFGCLCFPWLRPYTSNKLQPRSKPCIFVGYSSSQYAYLCLDPQSHRIYTSRHVTFFYNHFPFRTPSPSNKFSIQESDSSHLPLHHVLPVPAPIPSQSSAPSPPTVPVIAPLDSVSSSAPPPYGD